MEHLKASGSLTDVIPTYFLKQVLDVVGPYHLTLVNCCFETGGMPGLLKHATVCPLLKKQSMDPTVLANFRLISNLSFITKIQEKTVLEQLQTSLVDNMIFEVFQSGFRKYHSTETALLKVFNDILLTCDLGMLFLDLTTAFDNVYHAVLIDRLEHCAGITGNALEWFKSYLTDSTFLV